MAGVNGPSKAFGADHAKRYDANAARVAPVNDVRHMLAGHILTELPDDARILCVGAGTGAEIAYFAALRPGWHFTAVDPAKDMLDVCRNKAEKGGYADRCAFHPGTVDTLPDSAPFEAATAFLVSQFIRDRAARVGFFADIATRLAPGGLLVTADLSTPLEGTARDDLYSVWFSMLRGANMPHDREAFERHVAVSTPDDVEGMIADGGFVHPIQYLQTLLIRGWFARRPRKDTA